MEIEEVASNLFDEYCEDGFDFDTSMTFDEIFRKIFVDAVKITVDTYESEEEDEE
jgi:hypothetical protein